MGQVNIKRLEVLEGAFTFTSKSLSNLISQIDSRLNGADVYETITRTNDLISKVEVFSDLARTQKLIERSFTRTTGTNGVSYISTMTTIFFNDDSSEDSRVTTTFTRDGNNRITNCDNVFSTTESDC